MKKLLVVLMICLVANSAMAIDLDKVKQKTVNTLTQVAGLSINTNLKQKQAEKEYQENYIDTPEYRFKTHIAIIQEDKRGYDEGAESIYEEILNILNKNKSVYTVNTQYAEKAKQLYDEIIKYTPDDWPTPEEFNKKKIIILDSDFDQVDKDLKTIIYALNLY